jgi:aspartyl-tRNA(Asn)/glutamyl-tRNA(Gln) amidotransferase subunit B
VTRPDMRSSAEAVAYAKELHKIVTWIGICDGNMQEGSFRCDANVSVRKPGEPLGTRREIKNLNSFKFMQQAIDFEVRWQIEQIEDGKAIEQATVLFNPDTGETRAMRTKEDAADYRYFPDPDLPPLVIGRDWVEQVRGEMPELPRVMAERFVRDYELLEIDAQTLTTESAKAKYFEDLLAVLKQRNPAKWQDLGVGNGGSWYGRAACVVVNQLISARLNKEDLDFNDISVSPQIMGLIQSRHIEGVISANSMRDVFNLIWEDTALDVDTIIESKGLKQMNDSGALTKIVLDVIAANPKNVDEFKAGNTKALNALVGQIMKASAGKANPAQVNELLKKALA